MNEGAIWARGAMANSVGADKRGRKTIPIDVLAKTNQCMVHVDQLLKVDLKQLALWLLGFTLGAQRISPILVMFSTTSKNVIPEKHSLLPR